MSKKLSRYVDNRMEAISDIFHRRKNIISDQQIHTLRLEIKKVKAILAVMEETVKKFKRKKVFEPFEVIFDQAGKVREAQLMHKLLRDESSSKLTDRYLKDLQAQETVEKNKLHDMLDEAHWKALRRSASRVKAMLKKIPTKKAVAHVNAYEKKVLKQLQSTKLSPDNTHDMRKSLKDLSYQQNMLDLTPRWRFSDRFQELIGRWHDAAVLWAAFTGFTSQLKFKPPQQQLAQLIGNQIAWRVERAFDHILARQARLVKK